MAGRDRACMYISIDTVFDLHSFATAAPFALGALTEIRVRNALINNVDAPAFCAALSRCSALCTLSLVGVDFSALGAQRIDALPNLRTLNCMGIRGAFDARAIGVLAAAVVDSRAPISFSFSTAHVTADGARHLAAAMRRRGNVSLLAMKPASEDAVAELLPALSWCVVDELKLAMPHLTEAACLRASAGLLEANTALTTLTIEMAGLYDARAIVGALCTNTRLCKLIVRGHLLGHDAVREIVDCVARGNALVAARPALARLGAASARRVARHVRGNTGLRVISIGDGDGPVAANCATALLLEHHRCVALLRERRAWQPED